MVEADLILGLCDRFKCLPSQLANEDASLLRMIAIQDMGTPEEKKGGGQQWPT